MNDTLARQGYRMPAEFEPHEATWLAWPHNPETWPGRLKFIPPIWVQMIKPLHVHETVHICVNDAAMEDQVKAILKRHDIGRNVLLHQIPTNDAWARDHNAIFVTRTARNPLLNKEGASGEVSPLLATDWIFNSWGKKYGPWDLDDVVPQKAADYLKVPFVEPGIVLEGGSIDVNGKGTLLTTEQCLLNKNRNPQLKKSEIEQYLKDYLGVTNILWLGDGIVGDDTDGHVDDITRFVNEDTIVTVVEEDPADENYKPLQDNLKRLQSMKDQNGKPLKIVTMPMPGPVEYDGTRLPASYANFYIANGVVLVPIYNHANDKRALETLEKLFPTRRVVGINCVEMVWGLGAIHCVTQQQPKV
jgi:agmatine deiminase